MIGLAWTLTRAAGWPRMLLVCASTAAVSGLLLVAVAMLRLPAVPREELFNLVAEPGLRGGTAFGTVLLAVPPVLLLYQAVRLGTASRERRLAALRVAGATPRDVRGLGAFEVGAPSALGAVLGIGVYGLLRVVLGGSAVAAPGLRGTHGVRGLGLVPTTVAPAWWQLLLVVAAVTATGAVVGWRVSGRVVVTPLGVARRQRRRAPRPWGLLVLGLAAVVGAVAWATAPDVVAFAVIGVVVLGTMSLSSWAAYRVGRYAETRARSPAVLLAARRLVADPRPAGRAGAAVGGIALVAGGAGGIAAEVFTADGSRGPFFTVSLLVVAVALLLGLTAATGSLAVHSVETLVDRRRTFAALAAAGTPWTVMERAQRYEAALVALPMAAAGVLLGSFVVGAIGVRDVAGMSIVLATAVSTVALVHVAILGATRAVRPWLLQAVGPENLRTE